jgi:hypothetical protein
MSFWSNFERSKCVKAGGLRGFCQNFGGFSGKINTLAAFQELLRGVNETFSHFIPVCGAISAPALL